MDARENNPFLKILRIPCRIPFVKLYIDITTLLLIADNLALVEVDHSFLHLIHDFFIMCYDNNGGSALINLTCVRER